VGSADSYEIYWDTTPGVTMATGTLIAGATSPYLHSPLPNGTTHYYVIVAVRGSTRSAESAEVSATPMGTPTGVSAYPGNAQVTIAWNPVSGATSYNIYWAILPGVTPGSGNVISGAVSPHVHTGLTNQTTYYYVVVAAVGAAEGPPSAEVWATPNTAVGSVWVGTTFVTFSTATHIYQSAPGWSVVNLDSSSPPGYRVNLIWALDAHPGCPVDTCTGSLMADIVVPSGAWYWDSSCAETVTLCVTDFAASPGGQTRGTFHGSVKNIDPPFDVLNLPGGAFDALRQ
jgi:hypothetical protein